MTTVLEQGDALVVRCDDCRRLWPIQSASLDSIGWHHDEARDEHLCSVCATAAAQRCS
jgi:hypothetical protein